VEELTRILPRIRQMGMMQGVKDAGEFAVKFKDTISTINKMAKYLGTTMEDATAFFEHSRQMGIFDKKDQLAHMLNSQFTSGMTGMSVAQTMGMESAGAGMAQQFGARRELGMRGVSNMAQRIGYAERNKLVPEGLIQDVSGVEGPKGTEIAAQQMFALALNMSKTPMGQAVQIGLMKRDENGKVVLDDDLVRQLNRGQKSIDEIRERGESLSNDDKIAFKYQAENLGAEFAGKIDVAGVSRRLLRDKGKDAGKYHIKMMTGASAQQIDLLDAIGGADVGTDRENMLRIQEREKDIGERTDPSRIWSRIKTGIHAATFGAVEQEGMAFFTGVADKYERVIRSLAPRPSARR
jgi:hypothetical protein